MKIGLKTYREENMLKHFCKKVDFFEIMAIENEDYSFLKGFPKPIVVHAQHLVFGINNADKALYSKNLSSINFAMKIADFCKSKKIIFHPGRIENKGCSKENSIEFTKQIWDKRLLIENVPYSPDDKFLKTTPDIIREFMEKTNVKFCLDLNHAIETALELKLDYIGLIKEYLKLNPSHYHLSGGNIKKRIEHTSLKESDIDWVPILRLIPEDAELTLETDHEIKNREEDIKIIHSWMKQL